MKTTIKKLRALLLRESLREEGGALFGSLEDLDHSISAMDPDTLATHDYVDADTGEIYLEKGRASRTSSLHPEYTKDHAAKRAARNAEWEAEEATYAKEDEDWENEKERARSEAEVAWVAALAEYAGNWTDYKVSMGNEYDDEAVQGFVGDAAEGFFSHYPDWKRWAIELGMKKHDMKSAIVDYVYETITTGQVPN